MKKVTFSHRLLVSGVIKAAKVIKSVYGPLGGVSLLNTNFSKTLTTRDGAQICRSLEFENPLENMGLKIARENSLLVENRVGDGTSTAILLLAAILSEGYKYAEAGEDIIKICDSLDDFKEYILNEVLPLLKKDTSVKRLKSSIYGAMNNDESISNLVSSSLMKIGKGGVLAIRDGDKVEDVFELQEGFEIESGYESPKFLDSDSSEINLEGAAIVLFNDFIFNTEDIIPMMEAASEFQRPLLIFSHGVTGEALKTMLLNNNKKVIQSCAVRAEGNKFTYIDFLKDVQAFTGGEIIDSKKGLELKNFKREWLGFCRHALIKRQKTIIQAYPENMSIENRLKELNLERSQSAHDWDQDRFSNRIARISGGFGVIKVGGFTETEKQERKGRLEDAILNGKASVEHGLLPGCGSILPILYECLEGDSLGELILKKSFKKLYNTLYRDEGFYFNKLKEFQKKNIENKPEEWCIDIKTGDIIEIEVYEPYNLFKTCLEVGVSNAIQILKSNVSIFR